MQTDTETSPSGFMAPLRHRSFALFQTAKFLASLATQIQTVAVGAQVYSLTHRPLDLGIVGLSQFLPFLLFVMPAGQAADHYDRRRLLLLCFAVELVCGAALLWFTASGMRAPWPVFAIMVAFGVARAFSAPADSALLPNLVPRELFGNAIGINSTAWQFSVIAGPALGGLLYASHGAGAAYLTVIALLIVSLVCLWFVRSPPQAAPTGAATLHTLLEGLRFVRSRPVILCAISLDLFAVLLGGATAMLPAYASDVLHVGAGGLGWLRASPGIGAALVAVLLSVRPITRQVGPMMFSGVLVFGIATVLFGLSTNYAWSLLLLAVLGAADMISVFVRHMLVQLETQDSMRGRVGAVNSMFIGASNELGEFESGLMATWLGLVPSVALGGVLTVLVVIGCAALFPVLRRMDRFPDMHPGD